MKRLIAILTLFLVIYSCIKLPVDSGDTSSSILLKNNTFGYVDLSWDKTYISTFKEYIILSSSFSIKDYKNISDIPSNMIIARITDYEQNFFKDSVLLKSAYYKVFVNIGDRLLISNEVHINTSIFYLDNIFSISSSYLDDDNNRLVLLDNSSNKYMISIDINKETYNYDYLGNIPKIRWFGKGKFENQNEYYVPVSNIINIYDANSINLIDTINTTDCSSISFGNDSILYCSSSSRNRIMAINRKTKRKMYEFGRAFALDNLCKVSNSDEIFRVRNTSTLAYMDYYHFDPKTGKVIDSIYNVLTINQMTFDGTKISISKSGSFFVIGIVNSINHVVLSKNLQMLGQIVLPFEYNNSSIFSCISPNEKYIAMLTNLNINNDISVYSGVSPYNIIKKYNSRITNVSSITMDNENIYVIGLAKHPIINAFVTAIETIKL